MSKLFHDPCESPLAVFCSILAKPLWYESKTFHDHCECPPVFLRPFLSLKKLSNISLIYFITPTKVLQFFSAPIAETFLYLSKTFNDPCKSFPGLLKKESKEGCMAFAGVMKFIIYILDNFARGRSKAWGDVYWRAFAGFMKYIKHASQGFSKSRRSRRAGGLLHFIYLFYIYLTLAIKICN